jgi:uncharacterized membrane protein
MKKNRIFKVVVWRIFSTTIALLISWAWIGELRSSAALTGVITIVMMFLHYNFEVFWERIGF